MIGEHYVDDTLRRPYSAAMVLNDEELKQFDKLLSAIDRAVGHYPDRFRHCSLEALTEGSKPVLCFVRAGVEIHGKNELLNYGKFQLRRESFSTDELHARLESVNTKGILPSEFGDIDIGTQPRIQHHQWFPSHSEYHGWPGRFYNIAPNASSSDFIQPEPLVARELPPYFDHKDAIRHWIGLQVNDNDGRYRRFLLFIPEFAARVDCVTFADSVLRVTCNSSDQDNLGISVLASNEIEIFRKTERLQENQSFKIMSNPTQLRVFITNENGKVLDQFSDDPGHGRSVLNHVRSTERLMEIIRSGETDTVEFKTFVRLDDKKDKKATELLKVAISFSNTKGGTLFIGVSDDAEVVGVDSNIPHDKQKAATFEAEYISDLRKLFKDCLNRLPRIDIRSEKIDGKTVFVVRVDEGSAKPYCNFQTREIFVRKGASDMRPDPDSELRQMFGSNFPSEFGLPDWNQ